MLSVITTTTICIVSIWLANRIHLAYFSPLAKIPNSHSTTPLSNIWTIINKWNDCENRARYKAHERLGPVVRIGPAEISVNCIDGGVRTVYGAEFDKNVWYPRVLGGDGVPCMFAMLSKKQHAERRRMLSNVYVKTNVQTSRTLELIGETILDRRLRTEVGAWARDGIVVDVLERNKSYLMDLTTAWLFGLGNATDFLRDRIAAMQFFSDFEKSIAGSFWRGEFCTLTRMLALFGVNLVPLSVKCCRRRIEEWSSAKCDAAFKSMVAHDDTHGIVDSNSFPTVYAQLRQGLERSDTPPEDFDAIFSVELQDHVVASHDVTGVTLSWVMYELSVRPYMQSALRFELCKPTAHTLPPMVHGIDALKYLDAVIMETIRLRSANPGPWPRRVPSQGCSIGKFNDIPAGTVVSASSYTLHRNADVFPEPEEWRPERWWKATEEQRKEMMQWFWAFGSGTRMCIGNHFAIRSMKMVLATVYAEFETSLVDERDLEQRDSVVAGPIGGKVLLKFQHAYPSDGGTERA